MTRASPLAREVVAGARIGGGGDGDPRHAGKQLDQPAQAAIVGPEVVAPLGDAVRLVDGDQAERQLAQPVDHVRLGQALGRDIEQVELSGLGRAPDGRAVVHGDSGVEPRGGDAQLFQRLDLVGHQGDQGRDDQAQAWAQHGGDLIADALAAAGRQDGQDVAPGQDFLDHLRLTPPEVRMAPGPGQQRTRGVQPRRGAGVERSG